MKHPARPTQGRLTRSSRPRQTGTADRVVLGAIPGLERFLPGRYSPGATVRSAYGTWILPREFKGQAISLIDAGTMLG